MEDFWSRDIVTNTTKSAERVSAESITLSESDLQRFHLRLQWYQNAVNELRESMIENTDWIWKLWDSVLGWLGALWLSEAETGREIYQRNYDDLVNRAQRSWEEIIHQIEINQLTPQQVNEIETIRKWFEEIFWQKFQSPSFFQSVVNTDYIKYANYWAHGALWIVKWAWNGGSGAVEFIWESLGVLTAATLNSTARKQFLTDCELYWVNWLKKMLNLPMIWYNKDLWI